MTHRRPFSLNIPHVDYNYTQQTFSSPQPRPDRAFYRCSSSTACPLVLPPQYIHMPMMMPAMHPQPTPITFERPEVWSVSPESIHSMEYNEPMQDNKWPSHIRRFEETSWTQINTELELAQDAWKIRQGYFQKSVVLPEGKLVSVSLKKLNENEKDVNNRSVMRSRALLYAIYQYESNGRSEEEEFKQVSILFNILSCWVK